MYPLAHLRPTQPDAVASSSSSSSNSSSVGTRARMYIDLSLRLGRGLLEPGVGGARAG